MIRHRSVIHEVRVVLGILARKWEECYLGGSGGLAFSALNKNNEIEANDLDIFIKVPKGIHAEKITEALTTTTCTDIKEDVYFVILKDINNFYKKDGAKFFKIPGQIKLVKCKAISKHTQLVVASLDLIFIEEGTNLMDTVAPDISKLFYKIKTQRGRVAKLGFEPVAVPSKVANRLIKEKVCEIDYKLVLGNKFIDKIASRCNKLGLDVRYINMPQEPAITFDANQTATFNGSVGIGLAPTTNLNIMSPRDAVLKWDASS